MHKEYFRIVAFTGYSGKITALCLELGQIAVGNSLEDAIVSVIDQSAALLIEAEKTNYSPFNPASKEIWGVYMPGMIAIKEQELAIKEEYAAVFRCYDRTDVGDPMKIVRESDDLLNKIDTITSD